VLNANVNDYSGYLQLRAAGSRASARGNYPAAEQAYRDALDIETRLFGPNSAAVGATLLELALQISNQQRFDEAAALFRRATPIIEASPSPEIRARLASYRGLDAANQRHYEEALRYARQDTAARQAAVDAVRNGGLDMNGNVPMVSTLLDGELAHALRVQAALARKITEVARIVHEAGGLLYYDGANLNAILGKVRPGDMGFDVIHMNLHKTFSTPHGGGGPGSGAVGVGARLAPFLPIPMVGKDGARFRWLTERDVPQSIGRLSGFMGNAGVNLRAYIYMRLLGREGMVRVAEFAALNANYLMKRLQAAGFEAAYPTRRASHEFIITLKRENRLYQVTAMDVAKRLLDYGFHAPTTYFPLLVPECLLIEPTETEAKEDLDRFCDAMIAIRREMEQEPEKLSSAPHTMPVRRLDDVRAAKQLDLAWKPAA